MFEKFREVKVMRDSIHGYIHLELRLIRELIDTYEFQRLRRIHQLGGTYQVYHTAEHSRFSHSLGVYEVVRRMVSEVKDIDDELSEFDKVSVMCAALLHDIGHGPFSHAFELISNTFHEDYTVRIILEDTNIHRILEKADKRLPNAVASIINHTHPNKLLTQLVSGQLDADRMDYLLRDSYCTGTSYGNFDLERVLRTLRVVHGKLVVKESGIHTIEDYIMSRYHMYWQVYYHPTSRVYEAIISGLFNRLRYLYNQDPSSIDEYKMFIPFIKGGDVSVKDYLDLDEASAFYGITLMRKSDDPILSDLARRILERDLFAVGTYVDEMTAKNVRLMVEKAGYDSKYYYYQDETRQVPYQPYVSEQHDPINVIREDGTCAELSTVSNIVAAIVQGEVKDEKKVFFPKGI